MAFIIKKVREWELLFSTGNKTLNVYLYKKLRISKIVWKNISMVVTDYSSTQPWTSPAFTMSISAVNKVINKDFY